MRPSRWKVRRLSTALAVSLAIHGAAVLGVVGTSLWNAWPALPIDIEISTLQVDEVKDLPLGPPAPATRPVDPSDVVAPQVKGDEPGAKPPTQKPKPKPKPETPAIDDPQVRVGPLPKPTSVRSYAPEGSRVVALVRIDRLRGTPYADAVDNVLKLLPDRRDLLEGTDMDLYRDVDALLAATPNPMDPTVTLLAVRHRLSDAALREALDKGARATGRKLSWKIARGRPFAERTLAAAGAGAANVGAVNGAAANSAAANSAAANRVRRRDERLIILAAPKLAVVTPPSYRKLMLQGPGGGRAASGMGGAGGAGGAVGLSVATTVPVVSGAGGVGGASPTAGVAPPPGEDDWAALINRIDAEDSVLPADAVAMLSVSGVFGANGISAVAGTRGTVDDAPAPAPAAATIMGLPAPQVVNLTLGATPQPFANIDVDFDAVAPAERWLQEWPQLRHQALTNPIVIITGLAHIVSGVTVTRDEATLHVHVEATQDETIRILSFIATQLPLLRR